MGAHSVKQYVISSLFNFFCKGKYSLKGTESFLAKSKGEIKINLKLKAWQHIEKKKEMGITERVEIDTM